MSLETWFLVSCFLQSERTYSKQDYPSHTNCAHPHTHFLADKILTALVQWCVTARVQSLARWHRCCDRSQDEHLPHLPGPPRQQSGRRRRHCSRTSCEGNGFDVCSVVVQSMRWLFPKMSLYTMLMVCVLRNDVEQFLSHVCVRRVLGHKNILAPSAAERQDVMR